MANCPIGFESIILLKSAFLHRTSEPILKSVKWKIRRRMRLLKIVRAKSQWTRVAENNTNRNILSDSRALREVNEFSTHLAFDYSNEPSAPFKPNWISFIALTTFEGALTSIRKITDPLRRWRAMTSWRIAWTSVEDLLLQVISFSTWEFLLFHCRSWFEKIYQASPLTKICFAFW